MTSLLRSCCVTRLNNDCERNKFLTRCTVNVEPIFLIHKEAKRMKRQLDMRMIAEHETVRTLQKILVRNAYTCPAQDKVLHTRIHFSSEDTVTNSAIWLALSAVRILLPLLLGTVTLSWVARKIPIFVAFFHKYIFFCRLSSILKRSIFKQIKKGKRGLISWTYPSSHSFLSIHIGCQQKIVFETNLW